MGGWGWIDWLVFCVLVAPGWCAFVFMIPAYLKARASAQAMACIARGILEDWRAGAFGRPYGGGEEEGEAPASGGQEGGEDVG